MRVRIAAPLCNFNPRSHERSDSCYCLSCPVYSISIHAPTRGATCEPIEFLKRYCISIHAPTRGATINGFVNQLVLEFQSTLPREERQLEPSFEAVLKDISIHAPTRGATSYLILITLSLKNFNPRSHERSDTAHTASMSSNVYFNPRSHERSDRHS